MPTRFEGGVFYLGNGAFQDKLYVSDEGTLIKEQTFYDSDEQEFVDLKGSLVLPAFRDGHAHPLFAGREAKGLDISDCKTEQDVLTSLKNYLETNPNTHWIDGAVFDRSMPARFTRETLDSAVSEVPVVLHGDDHHTLWVNTKALEASGIIRDGLLIVETAGIDVDSQGMPTGILREWPAMRLVLDKAPQETLDSDVANLVWADKLLAIAGIVECFDGWIDRGMAETYIAAASSNQLSLDYKLCFRADPETFFDDLEYIKNMRDQVNQMSMLDGNSIKFFIDGVFGSATAMVKEPYESNGSHGAAVWDYTLLRKAIQIAAEEGFQIHIHAIGDAASALALEIFSSIPREQMKYSPVLIHAELTDESLITQMQDLGVIACVQPYWAQHNGMLDSCMHHLGEQRLNRLYAFRQMLDLGATVAFSSDWPVSSHEPLKGLSVAVNRRETANQEPHNPEQSITLEEAITAYTTGVQSMRIKPNNQFFELGSDFDAVVLDSNIFKSPALDIAKARVISTYKAGKKIF